MKKYYLYHIFLCMVSISMIHAAADFIPSIVKTPKKDQRIESAGKVKEHSVATLPSIQIFSKQGENNTKYTLSGAQVAFSNMLKNIVEAAGGQEMNPIPLDMTEAQVRFVARLLQYMHSLSTLKVEQTDQQLVEKIIQLGNKFELSFAQIFHLILYFDISKAFYAFVCEQPLPLPKTAAEEVEYNKSLDYVFTIAQQSVEGRNRLSENSSYLWQLFGRMLYRNYVQYPQGQVAINFITEHRGGIVQPRGKKGRSLHGSDIIKSIELMVLAAYMDQHPELYAHKIQEWEKTFSVDAQSSSRMVAIGKDDGTIALWNTLDGRVKKFGNRGMSRSFYVQLSPDETILLSATVDDSTSANLIRLWNIHSGKLQRTVNTGNSLPVFMNDGSMLLWPGQDGSLQMLNVRSGEIRSTEKRYKTVVSITGINEDISTIITTAPDGSMQLWDLKSGSLRVIKSDGSPMVMATFISDNDIAMLSQNGVLRVWNMKTGSATVFDDFNTRDSYEYSLGGFGDTFIIAGIKDGVVNVFSFKDDSLKKLSSPVSVAEHVTVSPDGSMVVVELQNKSLQVWNMYDNRSIVLEGKAFVSFSPAFNNFASLLVQGSEDGKVRLWDIKKGSSRIVAPGDPTYATLWTSFVLEDTMILVEKSSGMEFYGQTSLRRALQAPHEMVVA